MPRGAPRLQTTFSFRRPWSFPPHERGNGWARLFLRFATLVFRVFHLLADVPIRPDCRHFRGDLPCRPNKEHGYVCGDCPVYGPVTKRILLIKLGAIGDVIRTTPLLRRLRQEHPGCFITWLTLTPAI